MLAEGPDEKELVGWLEALKAREAGARKAEIRAQSARWVVLGLDGPFAWEVVSGLLGPGVLGMPYLSLLRRDDVLCIRGGKTGEYGYLLLVPHDDAPGADAKLVALGRTIDLAAVTHEALDVCALENAHFSVRTLRASALAADLGPIELQLQWRVAYARQFVGAEALRARRTDGAKVRATCVVASGPIAPGQPVRLGDDDVGEVLAASPSPTLGAWVGSALLDASSRTRTSRSRRRPRPAPCPSTTCTRRRSSTT